MQKLAAAHSIDVVFHCEANGVGEVSIPSELRSGGHFYFSAIGKIVGYLLEIAFFRDFAFPRFKIAHIIKLINTKTRKPETRNPMKDYSLKTVRHLSNQQRTELAMLLRYRTQTPKEQPRVYATLQQIAETLCRSISWV